MLQWARRWVPAYLLRWYRVVFRGPPFLAWRPMSGATAARAQHLKRLLAGMHPVVPGAVLAGCMPWATFGDLGCDAPGGPSGSAAPGGAGAGAAVDAGDDDPDWSFAREFHGELEFS